MKISLMHLKKCLDAKPGPLFQWPNQISILVQIYSPIYADHHQCQVEDDLLLSFLNGM